MAIKVSDSIKPGIMYRHKSEDGRTAKLIRAKPLLLEVVWPDGSHLLLDARDCVVTLDDYYPISENRPSEVSSDFDVESCYAEMMQCADKVDQYGIRDLDACVRLGTLVVDLNNWMSNGGQPPKAWAR